MDLVPGQKFLQPVHVIHGHPRDLGPHHLGVYVKGGQQLKAVAGKLKVFDEGTAQVARPQHHKGVALVDA